MTIEIEKLSKCFAENHFVLRDLSLSFGVGTFAGLLGPSGCGKTTLLRILAGLDAPSAGKISIEGDVWVDTSHRVLVAPERRNVGMVFQSYAVWPHMDVFENVAFPLRVRHKSREVIREEVHSALKAVRLEGLERRRPSELSGGQQQRVALARALVQRPRLLLLDEPLSNLDANLRATMRTEIRKIQESVGITAVIVTHDWKDAQALCDRVAVLKDGGLAQVGSPDEIARDPASDFVRSLVL